MSDKTNEKKFYIIGVPRTVQGLFAIVNSVFCYTLYAKSLGYTPIIDMKNFESQYFKDERKFKDNAWEYFFEQPCGYNLEDIKEKEVIYSEQSFYPPNGKVFELINDDIPVSNSLPSVKDSLKQEYKNLLKFTPDIKEYLEENFKRIIPNQDSVLGILCRGTDYLRKKPKKECRVPNPKTVIKKAKQVLKEYPNIKHIYVATEDAEIYQMFKDEFGEMLIENNQYKYGSNYKKKVFLSETKVNRKDHQYNLAKEYLLSVYILAKCNYFIGSRTTGTKWAWILSDSWKYSYIWDLGHYTPFINHIFSIKNRYIDKQKYKVITVLGIPLKFKGKNHTQ